MMAVYNRYRVLNVQIEIYFVNKTSVTGVPLAAVIYPSNVTSPVSSYTLAAQQPFAQMALMGAYSSGASLKVLNTRFNIANILGYPTNIDDDLSAPYTGSPQQIAYMHVVLDAWDRTSAFITDFVVKARFYSTVYDLVSPGDSIALRKPLPI